MEIRICEQSKTFSVIANNALTAPYILPKYCILKLWYAKLGDFWFLTFNTLNKPSKGDGSYERPKYLSLLYILIKFCILIYFDIVQPLVCKTVSTVCLQNGDEVLKENSSIFISLRLIFIIFISLRPCSHAQNLHL